LESTFFEVLLKQIIIRRFISIADRIPSSGDSYLTANLYYEVRGYTFLGDIMGISKIYIREAADEYLLSPKRIQELSYG